LEHAVLVHIKLSGGDFGSEQQRDAIHRMTDALEARIRAAEAGEFDGDEFGGGECVLYMYGTDADRLYSVILPVLRDSDLMDGGYAIKRYGPPGSQFETVGFG
jgi:hypothetical protein